jgi:hypothetical protein
VAVPLTPCRSYPYPSDASSIDVAADIAALATAIDTDLCDIASDAERIPIGTLRPTIKGTADTNWLVMGTSVANASTLYPTLFNMSPTAWRSGTTLNLPSMNDRTVFGAGTVNAGALGGSNSKSLNANNLPRHTHVIDPPNTGVSIFDPAHNHSQNAHIHGADIFIGGPATNFLPQAGNGVGGLSIHNSPTVDPAAGSNNPSYTGISASVDIAPFNSQDGNLANSPFDVMPAYMGVIWQIKAL